MTSTIEEALHLTQHVISVKQKIVGDPMNDPLGLGIAYTWYNETFCNKQTKK